MIRRASNLAVKSSLFGLIIIFAAIVVASENGYAVTQSITTRASLLCENMNAKGAETLTKIDSLSTKLTQAWDKRDANFTAKWAEIDKNVEIQRKTADDTRFADYSKLEAKSETTAQSEAVRAYENSVNAAVGARRTSYNEARQVFRTGVKSAIEGRRSVVNGQVNDFRASVNLAIEDAKTDCIDAKITKATTRLAFVDALKSAQNTFKAARGDDSKVKDSVRPLVDAREASFAAANQTFQTSMSAAKSALVAAFESGASVE